MMRKSVRGVSCDWRRLVSLFPFGVREGGRMLFPLFGAELSIVHNFLWKNLSFLAQIGEEAE